MGTKALILVIAEDGTTPCNTWYCNNALNMPVLLIKVESVALGTWLNASLEGARIVMFEADDSAVTTLGTKPSTPANEDNDEVEFKA